MQSHYVELQLHSQQFRAPSCQPSLWKFSCVCPDVLFMFCNNTVFRFVYTYYMHICIQVCPTVCVRNRIGDRERRARCSTPECATKYFVVESRLAVRRCTCVSASCRYSASGALAIETCFVLSFAVFVIVLD